MKRMWMLYLILLAPAAANADELRLRDGVTISGNYLGGTQKEMWFQRSTGGTEMIPLFLVESLKFDGVLGPIPSAKHRPAEAKPQVQPANTLLSQVKWAFALLFPRLQQSF